MTRIQYVSVCRKCAGNSCILLGIQPFQAFEINTIGRDYHYLTCDEVTMSIEKKTRLETLEIRNCQIIKHSNQLWTFARVNGRSINQNKNTTPYLLQRRQRVSSRLNTRSAWQRLIRSWFSRSSSFSLLFRLSFTTDQRFSSQFVIRSIAICF